MSEYERRLSAAQLRLRGKHPFFASLALFARIIVTERVDTAATNGRDIYFNPDFVDSLSREEVNGVLLHEVLHAALLHVSRRGTRDPYIWNYAADIVVNAMIREQRLDLPPDAVKHDDWGDRSVEEVYDLLQKKGMKSPPTLILDLQGDLASEGGMRIGNMHGSFTIDEQTARELRAHWRLARQQAKVIAKQWKRSQGNLGGSENREWALLDQPEIDWRAELWRYLVQTPVDFSGYDRRFVYRGLYVDQMEGEALRLWVAIDTSGSIDESELNKFMTELHGILRAYPNIQCSLYYADTDLYGPYELSAELPIPEPKGYGGTFFEPFFEELDRCPNADLPYLCVYLTDGWGSFPRKEPEIPTLWLVVAGGMVSEEFPFGKVVRLLGDE